MPPTGLSASPTAPEPPTRSRCAAKDSTVRACSRGRGWRGLPHVCDRALRRCAHTCVMTGMRHYAHMCTMTCIAGGGCHVRCVVMLAVAAPSPCWSCFFQSCTRQFVTKLLPARERSLQDPRQAVLPERILQHPVLPEGPRGYSDNEPNRPEAAIEAALARPRPVTGYRVSPRAVHPPNITPSSPCTPREPS